MRAPIQANRIPHPELEGPAPDCFPIAQWENWVKSERSIAAGGRLPNNPDGFCVVCTPRYQAAMIRRGRCRHPDVTFVADEDGDLLGVRPTSENCGTIEVPTKEAA